MMVGKKIHIEKWFKVGATPFQSWCQLYFVNSPDREVILMLKRMVSHTLFFGLVFKNTFLGNFQTGKLCGNWCWSLSHMITSCASFLLTSWLVFSDTFLCQFSKQRQYAATDAEVCYVDWQFVRNQCQILEYLFQAKSSLLLCHLRWVCGNILW